MKAKIHPQYHADCQVTCACGNTFTTGSTLPVIKIDICSQCHPFFTGKMKFIDTMGRVEKFSQQFKASQTKKFVKKADRKKKKDQADNKTPLTLKEMFDQEKKLAKGQSSSGRKFQWPITSSRKSTG